MNDEIQKMLAQQAVFAREVEASNRNLQKTLEDSSGARALIDQVNRHREFARAALGPVAEIQRLVRINEQARNSLLEGFRLPQLSETMLLFHAHQDEFSKNLRRYAEESTSGLQRALAAMRTPWLNLNSELQSMRGFATLQGIGHGLEDLPSFGVDLAGALRSDLGDWRDQIAFQDSTLQDLTARTEFYIERGLNPDLTGFPEEAFAESLELARIRFDPPPIVAAYEAPVPKGDDVDEEDGLARTNIAHDWLQRMETNLRSFIDRKMCGAFGSDWPRHRLPNGMYDRWQDKKQRAIANGEVERPLIAYADFTDYEPLICRRDNWPVFTPFFGRQESVRESLQRLYPVRICTMHARSITQDDVLFLYVEVRRIVKAME